MYVPSYLRVHRHFKYAQYTEFAELSILKQYSEITIFKTGLNWKFIFALYDTYIMNKYNPAEC